MKKVMLFAALSFLSIGLFAQMTISPTVGFGLSTSKIDYEYFSDYEYTSRSVAGVQLQRNISDKIGIGLALQYAGKGFKNIGADGSTVQTRYRYIEMVPTFEYKPSNFVGVFLGPSFGYLVGTDLKENNKWTNSVGDFVDATELGGVAGLKFYWNNAFMSLTFSRSLISISDLTLTDENGNKVKEVKEFNQGFRLGVGYNFQLKKK